MPVAIGDVGTLSRRRIGELGISDCLGRTRWRRVTRVLAETVPVAIREVNAVRRWRVADLGINGRRRRISRADIVYVLPVEGGLSRIFAVFSSQAETRAAISSVPRSMIRM